MKFYIPLQHAIANLHHLWTFRNKMTCFIPVPLDSDFSIHNIPFGVCSIERQEAPRPCSAIGDNVIDLLAMSQAGLFDQSQMKPYARRVFAQNTLNEFMALGRPLWRETRRIIQEVLRVGGPLEEDSSFHEKIIIPMNKVKMHMPIQIGDYTDFYASKEHATNVGIMFRGKENALQPNWLHLPVGYHGRSSSVVVSGTSIIRPSGQIKPKDGDPQFGVSQKLDFELEMAFVVGVGNELGSRITMERAEDHIFGLVLMNDWSARDIQAWEYVPLGPFLGKNFGTVISPWIVTLDALEYVKVSGPLQEPNPLPYLQDTKPGSYDINLEVSIVENGDSTGTSICQSNSKYLYWNFRQQLAHHTVNGCNMRTGDLCGSGTISGPTEDSYGSMLELSWNGSKSIKLNSGNSRVFINDGDTVILRGYAEKNGVRVGFGSCVSKVESK